MNRENMLKVKFAFLRTDGYNTAVMPLLSLEEDQLPLEERLDLLERRRGRLLKEAEDAANAERNGVNTIIIAGNFPQLAALQPELLETIQRRAKRSADLLEQPKSGTDWAISNGFPSEVDPSLHPELTSLPTIDLLKLKFLTAFRDLEGWEQIDSKFGDMLNDSRKENRMGFRPKRTPDEITEYQKALKTMVAVREDRVLVLADSLLREMEAQGLLGADLTPPQG